MEKFLNVLEQAAFEGAKILVVGCGGGGSNAVNFMVKEGIKGVDFAVVNTDLQAIETSVAPKKIQIGVKVTRGLGAGANPEVGKKAAEESIEEVEKLVDGYDLVFVATGLGGGTGTGSAPVVAEVAKRKGALTVGVVTLPYTFEGRPRMRKALEGKKTLIEHVDTIITIPNDRLTGHVESLGKKFNMKQALKEVDTVLKQAVEGITNLITKPGEINLDFADIRTVLSIKGSSLMGMGIGHGEDKIRIATEAAMKNPLLEHGIDGAKGLILNIAGNDNLGYQDFVLANEIISQYVDEDCEYIVGTVLDEDISEDQVIVTLVATGFQDTDSYVKKVELSQRVETSRVETPRFENSRTTVAPTVNREPVPSFIQEMEREERRKESIDESSFATKEMESIFDKIEMPSFMKNFGRN